jgi:hypothetical protein
MLHDIALTLAYIFASLVLVAASIVVCRSIVQQIAAIVVRLLIEPKRKRRLRASLVEKYATQSPAIRRASLLDEVTSEWKRQRKLYY